MTRPDDASNGTPAAGLVGADAPRIAGLTFRTYRGPEDLAGILAVLHAGHMADGIDWLPTLEDLQNEFATLINEDPERDVLLAELDGRIVAFGRASWAIRDGVHVYRSSGEVHPDVRRRGIGRAILRAEQRRLREIASGHHDAREQRLSSEAMDGQAGAAALLASEGYRPVRWFAEMVRDLSEPIPDSPMPPGVELRAVEPRDHRAIFYAESEAFRDHWGYREWTDTDMERVFGSPHLDTSLWRVAWDGDQVAGVIETFVYAAENEALGVSRAWLERISVRRPWRGRGLAKALISGALHGLRERGIAQAALGVDADNPTGAFGLYERMGFRVERRMEALARPLDDLPKA